MALFLFTFCILFLVTALAVGFGQAFLVTQQKEQVRKMLRRVATEGGKRRLDLLWQDAHQDALSHALGSIKAFSHIEKRILQAGLDWSVRRFCLMTAGLAIGGLVAGEIVPVLARLPIVPFVIAALGALMPYVVVSRKRRKRLAQFEERFPEALNFLSRSMRAGHAFSIGLEMLVVDAPEPLRSCFRRVLNSLQLGSPLETALAEMVDLVPLIDVRFFVSSVILQQTSGGNLSEILDTMAQIIRARFKLKGAVSAASAHGRITGIVLSAMPVVVGLILMVISPQYLMTLFSDPTGKKLVIGSVAAQMLGYLCIKKITNIQV